MTLREWVERYQRDVVLSQVHYRGVPSWKNVLDLWVLQEILWECDVDAVVEIGVRHGGTTLWLSDTLRTLRGDDALVVAVDLAAPDVGLPDNVHLIVGDSLAPDVLQEVGRLCAGRRSLVLADGNHAADHVLREMQEYGPLVAVGSYFIAEDGIVDVMGWERWTPGPRVAAHRFVAMNEAFEIDRSREKFLLTYCPDGFVRRTRSDDGAGEERERRSDARSEGSSRCPTCP